MGGLWVGPCKIGRVHVGGDVTAWLPGGVSGRLGTRETRPLSPPSNAQASLWWRTVPQLTSPSVTSVRPGPQRKPCCAGDHGLPDGVRTPDRAAASRRETATNPPAPSSQRNIFTRSKSQGQGPLYGQLSCATKAGRVEKRVVHCIVGDSINDEDRHVAPELSQPLVWICNMRYVIG